MLLAQGCNFNEKTTGAEAVLFFQLGRLMVTAYNLYNDNFVSLSLSQTLVHLSILASKPLYSFKKFDNNQSNLFRWLLLKY